MRNRTNDSFLNNLWSRGVIGSRVRLRSVSERVWVRFPPGLPPLSYRSSMGERCPALDGRCVSDPRRYEETISIQANRSSTHLLRDDSTRTQVISLGWTTCVDGREPSRPTSRDTDFNVVSHVAVFMAMWTKGKMVEPTCSKQDVLGSSNLLMTTI